MRIKKAVAYDTRQGRFTAIDSATLDPGMEQRNGKEVKCGAARSSKNEFWIGSVREQEAEAERTHRHTRRAEPARLRPQTKSYFPPKGGIAFSVNERIDGFLEFAIRAKFAYVNKRRGGLDSPPFCVAWGNIRAFCKQRRRRWEIGLWGNRNVIQQGRGEEDDSREF